MPNHINQLMTITEVSATLRIGESTIWRKVKEGLFPEPIKLGGSTRWHGAEIEQYIVSLTAEQRGHALPSDGSTLTLASRTESEKSNGVKSAMGGL